MSLRSYDAFSVEQCLLNQLYSTQQQRKCNKMWNRQQRQHHASRLVEDRFLRLADSTESVATECILEIDGMVLDVSRWVRAHPGGQKILAKYHGKDATKAFRAVGHSDSARSMLKDFCVGKSVSRQRSMTLRSTIGAFGTKSTDSPPAWLLSKLFTKEDARGFHKMFGVFSLCHFAYRFSLMLFGDLSAGYGSNGGDGEGPSIVAFLCLIPHAILSCSSLIFRTVPKERVVGKPMIWQEFRSHNIIFGLRSIICSAVAWTSLYHKHDAPWRRFAVCTTCATVLLSCWAADQATKILRHDAQESTTATMPYWKGCDPAVQYWFKYFYALAQFGATVACLQVSNPVWPLAILLPIQGASLLMTLVRKGIISARSYHMLYAGSLLLVFAVGVRYVLYCIWHQQYERAEDLIVLWAQAIVAYLLRRRGFDKYAIWIPVVAWRLTIGDRSIHWKDW